MALLGNYTPQNSNPGRAISGQSNLYGNFKPGSMCNFYTPDTDTTSQVSRASLYTGTQSPYSYLMAPKGGELSSTTGLGGVGTVSGSLVIAKTMTADLTGLGELTASMSLISSLVATLTGSGTLSGDMKLTIAMAAALIGAGNLSGASSLLLPMQASLSGVGDIVANLKGIADMQANIFVNSGTATTQELVAAVWGALAADFDASGTMGEKLNAAGTAGDPWTTDLSTYNTTDTAGLILKQTKAQAALAAALSA